MIGNNIISEQYLNELQCCIYSKIYIGKTKCIRYVTLNHSCSYWGWV